MLAGTGPVGMRAAAFLAKEGAEVTITSRSKARAEHAARAIEVAVRGEGARRSRRPTTLPVQRTSRARRSCSRPAPSAAALGGTGWEDKPDIEMLADVNAQPPLGIDGIEATDKGKDAVR